MKRENRFGEFIANLRNEREISQEQLSDGLCTPSMLCRFENGEREPEKLLQNRFLTRLGAVPENYENFLYYEEYCRWEKRQGIVHHILEEDIAKAKELLEEYRQTYHMENPLEEQFYLAMLVQIMRYEGSEDAELTALLGRALSLTVPKVEILGFMDRILSLEEINLLLEYMYCSDVGLERYEELLEYIDKMERTLLALAKIYPKTVYYYYVAWERTEKREQKLAERMLELCDRAIEILRSSNRMFYLWELFCIKEQLMPLLPEELREKEEVQKSFTECRGWRETLEEIYRDFGVTIQMYEFCYLYVESENYCIGDVIRVRRKMLGISQEKLCEGFCTPRTVSTLERNMKRPQKEVVQYLFDKLNLSTELNRTELITDNPEAVKKYKELKLKNNNQDFMQASGSSEVLREEIKELVSMDIPSNVQTMLRNEAISNYNIGKMSKHEYVAQLKRALECTVPYERAIMHGEKYLTNEEIACLQNITLEIDWSFSEMQECVDALIDVCERPKYPENYLRMYQFIMSAVSCFLGDRGDYENSNIIKQKIVRLLLINRKCGGLNEPIYGILWNNEQEDKKVSHEANYKIKRKEVLNKCIQLSMLYKNTRREEEYRDKLKKLDML